MVNEEAIKMINWQELLAHRTLGMRASEIRDAFQLSERPDIISFAGGFPAPESFPVNQLQQAMQSLLTREPEVALQYGPTEGIYELRSLVAERMRRDGVTVEPEQIIITNGSQQALDLLFKILINPGEPVLYELPAYIGGINAAINYEATPVGIPQDEQGLNVQALEQYLRRQRELGLQAPKVLYIVPNFHNPTGVTLSMARRPKLVDLAREYNFTIIEDNPYGELRLEGPSLPHLKTFDTDGRVFYLGSFSKICIPGVRLGWIAADPAIIQKVCIAKQGSDLCTNSLGQKLVCEFAKMGWLDQHVGTLKDVYKRKRDLALRALTEYLPAGIRWTHPQGGFFIWITLPEHLDAKQLLPRLVAEEQVAYVPGGAFFVDGSGKNTIRLAFSQVSEEDMVEGIKRMGCYLTRILGPTYSAHAEEACSA
jgi:2-aminoadipate transaminase